MKGHHSQSLRRSWWALAGISLASFLGCIDFTIVNTALPSIQSNLHASINQLQWIINGFMLALSALMVMSGRLADLFGRRKIFYIGLVIFGIASLAAGLAPTINWLIIFRLLQGVGVAILYTVPIAIISSLFPENKRGKATGILLGANGFGLAFGPVAGGFILSALSWHWVFFINLPIIVISFIICIPTLTESRSTEHGDTIDWWGFLLLLIGFPLLVFTTVEASMWGWLSAKTVGFYIIAIASLLAFYIVENKIESPIIKFKLFKNHKFFTGLSANFILAFFYTVAFFLMPLYLHDIQGFSSYQIGLALLPATIMVAILSPSVGHAMDKRGPKGLLLMGFALFALSALLQTYFSAQTNIFFILFAFILFGIGWAFILTPSFAAALSSVPESVSGVAMGSLGTLHNFGGAIGLAIGTVVYHYAAQHALASQLSGNAAWLQDAVSNPDNAVNIIQQATNVSSLQAQQLFENFFIHGYSATMGLLVLVSIVGIIAVAVGFKAKKH